MVRLKIEELRPEGRREGEEPGLRPYWSGYQSSGELVAPLPGRTPASLLRPVPGPRLTAEARSAIALAEEECLRLGAVAVGTEHLLLGILRHGDCQGASLQL